LNNRKSFAVFITAKGMTPIAPIAFGGMTFAIETFAEAIGIVALPLCGPNLLLGKGDG